MQVQWLFKRLFYWCVILVCRCTVETRGQLWSGFSASTFIWVFGIELTQTCVLGEQLLLPAESSDRPCCSEIRSYTIVCLAGNSLCIALNFKSSCLCLLTAEILGMHQLHFRLLGTIPSYSSISYRDRRHLRILVCLECPGTNPLVILRNSCYYLCNK